MKKAAFQTLQAAFGVCTEIAYALAIILAAFVVSCAAVYL